MIRMNNKVLLLLGCFFLSIASVYAQYEYQPFVKEGKVWLMSGRSDKGDSYSYDFQYLMQGDTISHILHLGDGSFEQDDI